MRLISDWKRVIKKAWSIRLMILAGLLSGAELILPLYADSIPRGTFALLTMAAVTCAFIARLVAQQEFERDAG
jgi:hypothetical protein